MQVQLAKVSRSKLLSLVPRAIAIVPLFCLALAALPVSAQTLDRIRDAGRIRFGYLADARPFSFRNDAGAPDGYAVALCQRIADALKTQLSRPTLLVDWVAVTGDTRIREVEQGNIDLLCSPISVTLMRRADAAFSIPVFPSGNRAVMRADAVPALRSALGGTGVVRPVWRGSPAAKVLEDTTFAVVSGTTSATWLEASGRLAPGRCADHACPGLSHGAATGAWLATSTCSSATARSCSAQWTTRRATTSWSSIGCSRTSRLRSRCRAATTIFAWLVDRTLSGLYTSNEFASLYQQWFGEFDADTRTFFMWNTLAE